MRIHYFSVYEQSNLSSFNQILCFAMFYLQPNSVWAAKVIDKNRIIVVGSVRTRKSVYSDTITHKRVRQGRDNQYKVTSNTDTHNWWSLRRTFMIRSANVWPTT